MDYIKGGNPTYLDFDLYGNIITDKDGNKLLDVKEQYPHSKLFLTSNLFDI